MDSPARACRSCHHHRASEQCVEYTRPKLGEESKLHSSPLSLAGLRNFDEVQLPGNLQETCPGVRVYMMVSKLGENSHVLWTEQQSNKEPFYFTFCSCLELSVCNDVLDRLKKCVIRDVV